MTNFRPFQIALYFGFGFLFIGAIVLLNTVNLGGDTSEQIGPVEIWGTLDSSVINRQISSIASNDKDNRFRNVSYRQIDTRNFDTVLVNAIAEGRQPDIVLLPHTKLVLHRNKLLPIQYETFPLRTFQDTYIDAFEIFALPDGLYAIPFAIDPLLMYWNRDLFANNGFASPPRTWETLTNNTVPTIVRRDEQRRISISPIAFGHYENISNAYGVLSMLLLQSGSRMIEEASGSYNIYLNQSRSGSGQPLNSSLYFFTRFGDSGNPLYSWSRTKPQDRNEFIAGNLATYFAKGSEYDDLRRQNPNLNFDVTAVPQPQAATTLRTYGDTYGYAILRTANNQNGAYVILQTLANAKNTKQMTDVLGMAPPHRNSIAGGNSAPVMQTVYDNALIARGWLNPHGTDELFRQAIGDIQSGRGSVSSVVQDLLSRLANLF